MGKTQKLTASDGHRLDAYRAEPSGNGNGAGLVVIQEIFGVNAHIRSVCDAYAKLGFTSIAPALFDRIEPGLELGYDADGVARGREGRSRIDWDDALKDIEAAALALPENRAVVGYCWGGSLAWLAATRFDLFKASVCYYGGQIVQFKDEEPNCPVIMHFGRKDPLITEEDVSAIHKAQPGVVIHQYDAGHGFNCDMRADYSEEASRLALGHTLDLIKRTMGV